MRKHHYASLSYTDLLDLIKNAAPGSESRELHRELKRYSDGLPLLRRYPMLLLMISAVTSAITALLVLFLGGYS